MDTILIYAFNGKKADQKAVFERMFAAADGVGDMENAPIEQGWRRGRVMRFQGSSEKLPAAAQQVFNEIAGGATPGDEPATFNVGTSDATFYLPEPKPGSV